MRTDIAALRMPAVILARFVFVRSARMVSVRLHKAVMTRMESVITVVGYEMEIISPRVQTGVRTQVPIVPVIERVVIQVVVVVIPQYIVVIVRDAVVDDDGHVIACVLIVVDFIG